MKIELYHASKFGNGAMVSEELKRIIEEKGHHVNVHHVRGSDPKKLPQADLYIFGSPTRIGKPIGSMRRFVKKVVLPKGTRYAVFATHGESAPDRKTGKMPSDEDMQRWRKTISIIDGVLKGKGLVKVAEKKFFVSAQSLKGPLVEGWEKEVVEFAARIAP